MAKANPLKKITAEAKRIRKKQPGKSWKSAVKEAGRKYKAGTIRAAKPKRVKRKAVARKKAKKRKRVARKKPVTTVVVRRRSTTVRARKVGRSAPVKRHRMAGSRGSGSTLKKLLPVALLVGAGLLLWEAFKPSAPSVPAGAPPLYQSPNQVRNDQSGQIVQYAIAAGLTLDAISRLIQNLNRQPDTQVADIYDELDRGGDLPATLYV